MNHPLYQKLKEAASEYTDEQIESATKQQVAGLLDMPIENLRSGLLKNMQVSLLAEREEERVKSQLLFIRDKIIAHFPDAVFEKSPRSTPEKPAIVVFINGK